MQIIFKKTFKKSFAKLTKKDQSDINDAMDIFQKNPFDVKLKNHALGGKLLGTRSIYAGFDLRILYREEGNHTLVYLIKTGTHAQVYED